MTGEESRELAMTYIQEEIDETGITLPEAMSRLAKSWYLLSDLYEAAGAHDHAEHLRAMLKICD